MTEEPKLQMIAQGREAEIFACEGRTVLRLFRSADGHQQVAWEAEAIETARSCGGPVPAAHGLTTAERSDPMFVAAAPPGYCRSPGLASD